MGNYIGIYTNKEAIDTQIDGKTDTLPYAFIDENTNVIYYNSTEEADAVPNYYSILVALVEGTETASVPIPNGVTAIRNQAFRQTNITGVEIPSSVTSIGQQSFYSCKQLTELYIPDTVTYIYDARTTNNSYLCAEDTALTTVHWPDNASITYITRYAFHNCTALTTINIPTTITFVGVYAFNNCPNLTLDISTLIYQLVNGGLGEYAFNGCTHVTGDIDAHNLTTIGVYEFTGTSITSFTGPNVATIGNNAFQNCKSLTEVYLTSALTLTGFYNGNNANRKNIFNGCSALTTIEFGTEETPNTVVTAFADATFANCTSLVWDNIRFPTTINTFQVSCFQGCTHLGSNIDVPSTVTTLGTSCFRACTDIEYVDISNVRTIPATCFYGCTNLQTVTIYTNPVFTNTCFQAAGIRYITIPATVSAANFYNSNNNNRKNIFNSCTHLHTISFEGNTLITGFAEGTFYGCTALRWKNITFPTAITVFQLNCFRGNTSLGPVVDIPEGITTLAAGCFYGCTNIHLAVWPTTLNIINGASNNGAFMNCTTMKTIIIKRQPLAPTTVASQTFQGHTATKGRIYIPHGVDLTEWRKKSDGTTNTVWTSTGNYYPAKFYNFYNLDENEKIPVTLNITYASNTITIKEAYGGTIRVSSTYTTTVFTRGEDTSTSGVLSFTDEMFNYTDAITVTVGTHTANETVTVQYTPNAEYAPYVESATGTVIIT